MNARDVIERLETLQPAPVMEAVALAVTFHTSPPDTAQLVELQPRIEKALRDLRDQTENTKGLIKRCKSLKSVPTRSAPAGF